MDTSGAHGKHAEQPPHGPRHGRFGGADHFKDHHGESGLEAFFMSGKAEELACDASMVAESEPTKQKLLEEAIFYALSYQFIGSPLLQGRQWRGEEGTGVGLVSSSSVAGAAFAV